MSKQTAYFDHASTTPLDKRVLSAMMPYFLENYGNPSNLYELGRNAKSAIYAATAQIASALKCRPDEIIYTGSATESDNLALAGIARANKENGNRILVSEIEHKGILSVCDALTKEGFEIIRIKVQKDGILDLNDFKEKLNDKTILVSITMADSETGTIQPINEVGALIKKFKKENKTTFPYFHTDASQAASYLEIRTDKLETDLITLSAHKMGGPKGIGALFVRKGTVIKPIIYGGGQQGNLRSGTQNVPGIVGFGKSFQINQQERSLECKRVKKLRDLLEKGILERIPKTLLNGNKKKRLPNFINVSILDVEGEALLLHLDELGIVVNTGSACNSESLEPSAVLSAIGNPYEFIHGSIRFTLGKTTKPKDIQYVLKHLPDAVQKLRSISPLNLNPDQTQALSDPKPFIGKQTPHFLRKKNANHK